MPSTAVGPTSVGAVEGALATEVPIDGFHQEGGYGVPRGSCVRSQRSAPVVAGRWGDAFDPAVVGGGKGKPCLAQLHVSIAPTMEAALDNAWEWWPSGVLPASVLGELAKPEDFFAVADAIGRDAIGEMVICATETASVVEAIRRFAGAGFDTAYLHKVGPDQQPLADLARTDLLPHYRQSA